MGKSTTKPEAAVGLRKKSIVTNNSNADGHTLSVDTSGRPDSKKDTTDNWWGRLGPRVAALVVEFQEKIWS